MDFCQLDWQELTQIPQTRIINGVKPKENTWSWLVRLHFLDKKEFESGTETLHKRPCGGTILNHNWILTAGHCCHNKVFVEINFQENKSTIK